MGWPSVVEALVATMEEGEVPCWTYRAFLPEFVHVTPGLEPTTPAESSVVRLSGVADWPGLACGVAVRLSSVTTCCLLQACRPWARQSSRRGRRASPSLPRPSRPARPTCG